MNIMKKKDKLRKEYYEFINKNNKKMYEQKVEFIRNLELLKHT